MVSNDGSYKVIPIDRNNTMENILNIGVESLVEQCVGVDLKEEATNQANNCARKIFLQQHYL